MRFPSTAWGGMAVIALCAAVLLLLPVLVRAQEASPEPEEEVSPADLGTTEGETPSGGDTAEEPDTSVEAEPEEMIEQEAIADPLEPWNRVVFTFNDRLYFWIMKPLAKGYNAVLPERVRVSIKNVFHNLTMPVRFVNSLLQGKLKPAGNELLRFVINSTGGLAGLFDLAKTGFHIES